MLCSAHVLVLATVNTGAKWVPCVSQHTAWHLCQEQGRDTHVWAGSHLRPGVSGVFLPSMPPVPPSPTLAPACGCATSHPRCTQTCAISCFVAAACIRDKTGGGVYVCVAAPEMRTSLVDESCSQSVSLPCWVCWVQLCGLRVCTTLLCRYSLSGCDPVARCWCACAAGINGVLSVCGCWGQHALPGLLYVH